MELYRRVDEVLHYRWDPIGVSSAPEACDEYQSYLPHVFSLLMGAASAQQIAEYLDTVTTQYMGFSSVPRGREHTRKVVAVLRRWREVTRIA